MRKCLPLLLVAALLPTQAHAFFFLAAIPVAVQWGIMAAMAAATIATTAMSVVSARKQAKYEEAQHKLNAKLEGTAALQRDTIRREELERTVGEGLQRGKGALLADCNIVSQRGERDHFVRSDHRVAELPPAAVRLSPAGA